MSDKKALCVGINKFKNYPSATLQGCVNDANNMQTLLVEQFSFKESDISLLTDSHATKSAIMKHLTEMVKGAVAGKYTHLVFSLSSHGTQIPDVDGDEEADHADEAFCPYDLAQSGSQWDLRHIISDDELHKLFSQLPTTCILEVYLDTCHSGTGLKSVDLLLDRKPRYLPPPSLSAFKQLENKKSRGLARLNLEKGISNHYLWAACRADQTSADAYIGDDWHGAFTYYLCKELSASNNSLTRKQLLKKVRADLKAGHYSQVPQLECDANLRETKLKPKLEKVIG